MDRHDESSYRDADRVYVELRRKILMLNLDPGAVLDESRIVQEMGTSRTPVREAIIRLVSEGLLRRDGRQIRVSTFEVKQLRAFFEGMTLMSRSVHRMAAARRTPQQLEAIRAALLTFENEVSKGDEIRISEANHAFHLAIANAADSVFIQRGYEELLVESLRLARQCFSRGEEPESTRREHLARTITDHKAVYDAIERRDVDEADRITTQHCHLFRERLSDQILGPPTEAVCISLAD